MEIRTERTVLTPFTLDLIEALKAKDYAKLEKLGFRCTEEWPEPDLLEALPVFELLIQMHGVNGFASWVVQERGNDAVIGSLGFIGPPDPEGRIELGFGIAPSRRGQGYCTEAVRGLLEWVAGRAEVSKVIAHCDPANAGSKNVLTKSGFACLGEAEGLVEWERPNA